MITSRAAERLDQRTDPYCRALDLLVSGVLCLVALPIILVTAVGSAAALRAWPFFVQERVGKGGAPFRFIKIRTLPIEVPSYTDKHGLDLVTIPAFCRALRRLHLDELPQLLLVLRGHMSLVGPRPEMAYLHEQLVPGFATLRTSARPGCTGLWQISEASAGLIGEAPEYDSFYLANRTLRLDLWVLLHTASNMVGIGRPVRLDEVPAWAVRGTTPVHTIDLRDAIDGRREQGSHERIQVPV